MGIISGDMIVKNKEKGPEKIGLNSKEIGFVLNLIDEARISGQFLEIALSTRNKLRKALNKLVEKETGV